MSVGSAQGVDPRYLKKLKFCIDQVEPEWVSDHFAGLRWMGKFK